MRDVKGLQLMVMYNFSEANLNHFCFTICRTKLLSWYVYFTTDKHTNFIYSLLYCTHHHKQVKALFFVRWPPKKFNRHDTKIVANLGKWKISQNNLATVKDLLHYTFFNIRKRSHSILQIVFSNKKVTSHVKVTVLSI